MKIFSWNVNGIRAVARKGALEEFINKCKPDVALFQEIKGKPEQFDENILNETNFKKYFHPAEKAGYSGVAVWVSQKYADKIGEIKKGIPTLNDKEGRIICADVDDLSIFSVYVPNGGKSEEAFAHKLEFFSKFREHLINCKKNGRKIIVGGDFNVARTEIDLAQPEKNENNVCYTKSVREKMESFLSKEFIDTFREKYPDKKEAYTYWDNFDFSLPRGTKPREVNRGWRIDYMVVDTDTHKTTKNPDIHSEIMGSDHCPVSIEI